MHYFLGILLGIFPVLRDGLWGFVNEKGERVLDTKYDYISNPNKRGYYVVGSKMNYGLVDSTGREALPLEYANIGFVYDSLMIVSKDGQKFLLDASYKRLIAEPLVSFKNISPGRIYYADTANLKNVQSIYMFETTLGKKGFLCKSKVLKPEYDEYSFFKNKYLKLRKDGKILITDLKLDALNSTHFDEIEDLGAYYVFKQQNNYGLLRANFTVLLKPIYRSITTQAFHDKQYIIYQMHATNRVAIYDLEIEKEILRLPYDAISELENGDLVDSYKGFPKYIQVTAASGKTGVYDLEKQQLVVSATHSSLAYLNKDRFITYDNYSKFQVIYNNKVISKDTIVGYVQPFDTLPVTAFYKDIMHQGKIVRFWGAFNLNGEVLVPYPVTEMQIMPKKITFSTKQGTKSVVKYDEDGKFEEFIDNYTSIVIHDTTATERPKRFYNPCVNDRMDYTSLYQFLYTTETIGTGVDRRSVERKRIYSKERNDCMFGRASFADAHLKNLATYSICPIYTKDHFYKFGDARKNKTIDMLTTNVDGKTMKKKFSFVSAFTEGLAAVDFNQAEQGLIDRAKKNEAYFGGLYGGRNFYSDGYVPKSYMYHTGVWGFVDTTTKVVIQPRYTRVEQFFAGVAVVMEGPRYSLINKNGENVAKKNFAKIDRLDCDTLFLVQEGFGGLGFIDKKFKTLLPADNRGKVDAPGNNIYPILCKNKKWAYRHFEGRWITDSIFSAVKPFVEGRAAAAQDNLWSFIDTTGKAIGPFMYAEVKSMQSNRAFVKLPNKDEFFVIDEKGLKVGKLQFENGYPYEQDLAVVSKDGHWGVIDHNGEWVYKNEFTSISPFNIRGEAKAVKGAEIFIISSEKNIRKFDKKEMTYEKNAQKLDRSEIMEYNDMINSKLKGIALYADKKLFYKNSIEETNYMPFVQSYKCGLLARSGAFKLEMEYQYIEHYINDLFKVYKNNEIGYFSLSKGWVYKPW